MSLQLFLLGLALFMITVIFMAVHVLTRQPRKLTKDD